MTLAINYNLEKDPSGLREIFGMQVAVRDWFRAFFRYGRQQEISLLVDHIDALNRVREIAAEVGVDAARIVAYDRRFVQENYARFTTIFRPDPHAQTLFWQRQLVQGQGFAFCGLAHAISGFEAGELLEQYCLAPSDASDAIVCPSRAIASAIRTFWDLYADYLKVRFGADFRCPVQLPIIPLGIDIERFEHASAEAKRKAQRDALGIAEDEIVVLWVGRLSHAIKAHPIGMLQAVERAAALTNKKLHFVLFGYFVPEEAEGQFKALAADICRKAKVTFVSNKDPRFPESLWAAGDMFLSLIDNMQESFGLTPIEAMAAGLPRIISDWDGYRDSVDDGADGIMVPTCQPPAGAGHALSSLLLSGREMYGGFLAKTALTVAVDQDFAARAIAKLADNPELRKNMAARARERVKQFYSWQTVIPQYEKLWAEQAIGRKAGAANGGRKNYPSVMPQCPDPYAMYAGFPTTALKPSYRLAVSATAEEIKTLWQHDINVFGMDMMLHPDIVQKMISIVSAAPGISIADVMVGLRPVDEAALWRTISWLIKLGILRVA